MITEQELALIKQHRAGSGGSQAPGNSDWYGFMLTANGLIDRLVAEVERLRAIDHSRSEIVRLSEKEIGYYRAMLKRCADMLKFLRGCVGADLIEDSLYNIFMDDLSKLLEGGDDRSPESECDHDWVYSAGHQTRYGKTWTRKQCDKCDQIIDMGSPTSLSRRSNDDKEG